MYNDHSACELYACISFQETLYDDLHMYYPLDYDPNINDHSGKLKVLANLLGNIRTHSPGERVVVVSNYTQVWHSRINSAIHWIVIFSIVAEF